MTAPAATWLQCPAPHPEPRQRLVCFPHAGGSASFFRDWGGHLPGSEVHAVNYPGRAGRIDEPPPSDLRELAREIAGAVATLADVPVALFGHSMGAPLALETARYLEAGGVRVSHLFASGSRDAPCPELDPADADLDPDAVLKRLVELGGTDPELAADPDFQELVLPYVVSDTRMFHAYAMRPGPTLHCPVTAIVGDSDVDADRRPWSELTAGAFRERGVRGAHFYLISDPPYAVLREALETTTEETAPWPQTG